VTDDSKLGLNATWSMAVGGMVGGGIFSVLGVVVSLAGGLAWLSFVVAGLIALATAVSYVALADELGEGGGAFTFLRTFHHQSLAASLSWVLIVGYVLTMSVYAFTFGHYLGEVLGLGPLAVRLAAVVIVAALVIVNLRGVGDSARLEIVAVWAKLAVLLVLAAIGLWRFDSANLGAGVPTGDLGGVIVGAASVFMAYEGFQLLTYD
jgi:amino acid transporter